jgi:hypothetical protein
MNMHARHLWLIVYLSFLFVFLGGRGPFANEVHYLAKAKHYWDADWCRGDPFLESADVHLGFCTAIGWLTQLVSLPIAAWVSRTASWVLIAGGWRRLCKSVGLDELDTFLAFGLTVFLVGTLNLAGEWFIGGVEGKPFSYGFLFYALAYAWQGRWNPAWICSGLAVFFHPVVGGWALLGLGATWLSSLARVEQWNVLVPVNQPSGDDCHGLRRSLVRSTLPGMIVGAAIAAAGVVPILAISFSSAEEQAARAEQIHVYQRLPHHLVFHRMASWNRLRFGGLVATWCLLAWWQRHQRDVRPLHGFVLYCLALTTVGMVIDLATWQSPDVGARWLQFYWFRMSDVLVPVGIAVGSFVAAQKHSTIAAEWLRAMALVLLAAVAVGQFWNHRTDPRPLADRQGQFGLAGSTADRVQRYEDWKALCAWARQNTSPTALFLTPTHSQTFKWYAERPEFVTWKDCPQDPDSILQWRDKLDRIEALSLYHGPSRPTERDWQDFALLQGIDFVITLRERQPGALAIPHAYRNGTFDVYRIVE